MGDEKPQFKTLTVSAVQDYTPYLIDELSFDNF